MTENKFWDHENAARILTEGWNLFQQKGYRGVSIDELCQRCNLTKPTLYYYFHDKETLFVQVLQYRLKNFHAVIEEPGPLPERLQRVAEVILASFQHEYGLLLRDREHIKDPANQQLIREAFFTELFEPIINLMRTGIAEGILVDQDPELLGRLYMGVINGFIGRVEETGLDIPSLAQLLTTFFLKGARRDE